MTNQDPNAIFNIGSQQGNISNVAGNQTNYGDQQYNAAHVNIRQELLNLRGAISTLNLDPAVQGSIRKLLADADRELDQPHPDAQEIESPIKRLTVLLKNAGAISAAGAALIEPLQHIASSLGAAGSAILQLLM